MQDLNDLYFFAQVVDHQGFAAAGRALRIPKSTLSRRISSLENQLGVRLVQRSTRRFSVTEIGQSYYVHCKAMLVEAQAAQQAIDLNRSEPRGIVRVTCPVALLHGRVGTILGDFLAENPRVTVHLEATNRVVDVISEGLDVALRVHASPFKDSDLVIKVLGERSWCLVASPAFLQTHGLPQTPADLVATPSLDLGPPYHEHVWQLEGPGGETATVRHTPRFVTDDMSTLKQAALAGVGVVQLPLVMVYDELKLGTLEKITPSWRPKNAIIHAVFPSRRGLLPSVRALIDFLAMRFEQVDDL